MTTAGDERHLARLSSRRPRPRWWAGCLLSLAVVLLLLCALQQLAPANCDEAPQVVGLPKDYTAANRVGALGLEVAAREEARRVANTSGAFGRPQHERGPSANKQAGELRRAKRLAGAAFGRGELGRIKLAQRPRSSSTTTSATSSATSEPARDSEQERQRERSRGGQGEKSLGLEEPLAEESSDSGDYEELEPSAAAAAAKQTKSSSSPRTPAPVRRPAEEKEEEGAAETVEEAPAEEEQEEEERQQQTTTTTTTQRTTTPRRAGGSRKGSAPRGRPTSRAPTTSAAPASSSATSRAADESQEDGRQAAGTHDAEEAPTDSARRQNASSRPAASREADHHWHHQRKGRPLMALPFIRPKNMSVCTPEAYLEFPRDLIGEKWRSRGLLVVHLFVVCYMFYSLALVCERYFMPSLEEFAQRLEISEDVAGATLMSAGSSAPELFTAILGVFVAKGDVGTGAIVGSAVFNILFVIGVCAFVSTTTAQLQWWPVLRDTVYYTFTVLVLILIIYDERITALESASMICLYGVYILIMMHNEQLKACATRLLLAHPLTAQLIGGAAQSMSSVEGPDDVFGQPLGSTSGGGGGSLRAKDQTGANANATANSSATSATGGGGRRVEEDSIYLAAQLLMVRHKRLFRGPLRFQAAARYAIVKRQHKRQQTRHQHQLEAAEAEAQRRASKHQQQRQHEEVNYFGPESEPLNGRLEGAACSPTSRRAKMEAYARSATSLSKSKFSIVSKDDYEFWNRPPSEPGPYYYYLWLAKIPVNYVLHYTIPDCALQPDKYALTFVISICWTALFSYIMVWMVTIIGYTLGIPDSVMGVTFLAAGTSVPDCYSSIHAARNGMADMAVSNSIGSNVFDILIGLAVPWFIQSAVYPGVVATVNSRGVIYSVVLLFLALLVTIYLMNRYDWSLQPRLGLALLIAYALFIVLTCMLEFNLFGHVNPPTCPPATGTNY